MLTQVRQLDVHPNADLVIHREGKTNVRSVGPPVRVPFLRANLSVDLDQQIRKGDSSVASASINEVDGRARGVLLLRKRGKHKGRCVDRGEGRERFAGLAADCFAPDVVVRAPTGTRSHFSVCLLLASHFSPLASRLVNLLCDLPTYGLCASAFLEHAGAQLTRCYEYRSAGIGHSSLPHYGVHHGNQVGCANCRHGSSTVSARPVSHATPFPP